MVDNSLSVIEFFVVFQYNDMGNHKIHFLKSGRIIYETTIIRPFYIYKVNSLCVTLCGYDNVYFTVWNYGWRICF